MHVYIVIDRDRWGHSTNIVRAASREAAIEFVCPGSDPNKVEVEELREGEGILWCEDISPDTGEGY